MSNGSPPLVWGGFWPSGMKSNSACGSMNRRISHAHPIRSTPTFCHVSHLMVRVSSLCCVYLVSPGREQRLSYLPAEFAPEVILRQDLLVLSRERGQVRPL